MPMGWVSVWDSHWLAIPSISVPSLFLHICVLTTYMGIYFLLSPNKRQFLFIIVETNLGRLKKKLNNFLNSEFFLFHFVFSALKIGSRACTSHANTESPSYPTTFAGSLKSFVRWEVRQLSIFYSCLVLLTVLTIGSL